MRILVTGHRGYIGKHLFNKLKSLSYDVYGIDLKDGLDVLFSLPDKDFDIVFHLAALPSVSFSVDNPSYSYRHNSYATSVLLEWAKNHGVSRFIFSSSAAVYGDGSDPVSPYGLQKLLSEKECKLYSKLYGLDTVSLRYFNVYSQDQQYGGPYSTVISAWMEMVRQCRPLCINGTGEQIRDFVHVDDIVAANMFCMNYKEKLNGDAYDVGTGENFSLNQVRDIILSTIKADFATKPARAGDIGESKISNNNLMSIGWSPQVDFKKQIIKYFTELKNE